MRRTVRKTVKRAVSRTVRRTVRRSVGRAVRRTARRMFKKDALPGLIRARDRLKLSRPLKRRPRHWDTLLLRDDPGERATVHARRRVETRVGKGRNRTLVGKGGKGNKG